MGRRLRERERFGTTMGKRLRKVEHKKQKKGNERIGVERKNKINENTVVVRIDKEELKVEEYNNENLK